MREFKPQIIKYDEDKCLNKYCKPKVDKKVRNSAFTAFQIDKIGIIKTAFKVGHDVCSFYNVGFLRTVKRFTSITIFNM